jgi:hypothetical protein
MPNLEPDAEETEFINQKIDIHGCSLPKSDETCPASVIGGGFLVGIAASG